VEPVAEKPGDLDGEMERRAQDHAVHQTMDAQAGCRQGQRAEAHRLAGCQDEGAEDLADVVSHRRQGREQEGLIRLQAGYDQAAHGEEQRGRQVEPHELHDKGLHVGGEARGDTNLAADQGIGQDGDNVCQAGRDQECQIGDATEEGPQGGTAVAIQDGRQHGDESDAEGAAGDQGEQQVGDVVGGVEGVEGGADAELAADDRYADQAEGLVQREEQGDL
jgi:hypothetical protein